MTSRPDLLPTPETPDYAGFSEASVHILPVATSLATKWDEAQSETMSGKLAQLHPRDLGFWGNRFSADELDELVIPKRTLARRRARKEALSLEESDKALRLARIVTEADRVFGEPAKTDRWLRRANPVFGGTAPLMMLKTEVGGNAVETLLHQIDHGIFI